MIIVVQETKRISGKQSIVKEGDQHFLVSSVTNPVVDKTYILKCNENGVVKDWNEVYTVSPANHELTLDALESGVIGVENFNFVK
jgi:hypothetical protein